jgi:hypothetical protein
LAPDEIVSAVYDAVARANKECPKHSFILPQMIKILPQSTLIPVTDKGTLMRKRAEIELKDIIDDMYNGLFKEPTTAQGNNKGGIVRKSKL